METQKEYTEEDAIKAFICIEANILINAYTNENALFGRIKANDQVPVKRYLEEMGFRNIEKYLDDLFLNGRNIENGYVLDRDFHESCFEHYSANIDILFHGIPIDKSFEGNDDIFHYKYGWYEFLKNLYPLFEEIIKTEVTPDLFSAVPDLLDETEKQNYYIAVSKFVLAIKTKGLRQGKRIDRYIKKMNFISPIIKRLLQKRKGHYYLVNSDINSLDYKLALLSCFRFMNEDNAKLFELKMLQWEENTKMAILKKV